MLASILAAVPLAACGPGSPSDPDNARCDDPRPTFAGPIVLPTHIQVAVHFTCEGTVQAGTLYVPNGLGLHAGAVWVHGDGPMRRIGYGEDNVVAGLVRAGIAVFSYDKRGVGESGGVCCPGGSGHFNLLAADAIGAVNALRSMPGIVPPSDPRALPMVVAWITSHLHAPAG